MLFGHIGVLDSYFDGEIDIEGDLARMFALGLDGGFSNPQPLVRVRRENSFCIGDPNLRRSADE